MRPITLLNCDYKIWAKTIANRLDSVSPYLIGNQQTGFMKGRSIFSNIRKTAEIVAHLNRSKQAGVIVQVDFEKCFDCVEFESIHKTFQYFGFGECFISMLMLLYSNLELCTINNGYTSSV